MIQVNITPAKDTKPNNTLVGQLAVVNCIADLNTDIGPDMSSLHKEWYRNDKMITTAQRGNKVQLQLKKVKTSFAGYYECIAWIDDNTLRNKSDDILLYVNCECIYSSKCFKLITLLSLLVMLIILYTYMESAWMLDPSFFSLNKLLMHAFFFELLLSQLLTDLLHFLSNTF